jgi:integrase
MLPYEAEDYAENLISQVQKKDEKIAQRDFDMAKMVDFLT